MRPAEAFLAGLAAGDTEPVVLIADTTQSDRFEALRNTPNHVVILANDRATAQALGKRRFLIAEVRNPATTARLLDIACRLAISRHKGGKLNGTGYPRRLMDEETPIQTRMITIADVFDALTSSDRPYKPAVTPDKALEIIRAEADKGLLDRALVDIMIESCAYRQTTEKDRHRLCAI